jgi:hypothetical protein
MNSEGETDEPYPNDDLAEASDAEGEPDEHPDGDTEDLSGP